MHPVINSAMHATEHAGACTATPPAGVALPRSSEAAPLSVIDTLELAKRELVFMGGCVATDRPDLPLSPETSWVPDFSRVVAAIDDAMDQLVGVGRRTDPGCDRCSSRPQSAQISARTKYVQARWDSRTPDGERL